MFNWRYSNYSKVNKYVKDNFPFETPRHEQLETISEIKEAIDNGYKYIILEAGTGTGKSAIAATLASMYDSSYILTVTKQLQDQYLNDFGDSGFKVVKGRGNFQCKKHEEEGVIETCDLGRCVVEGYHCLYSINNMPYYKRTEENTCCYYYQKWLALQSKVVISNYHYMFLELNYVDDFTNRSLLICDEAHNLESTLMNLLTLEFKRNELKEHLGINISREIVNTLENGNYEVWISFVEKIKNRYSEELDKIIDIKNKPELNVKISLMKKKIDDCNRFIEHIRQDPQSWIFDYDSRYGVVEFKPLKVDKYAKNTLFDYADICIFMSATILDYNLFSRWLGISQDNFYAIRRKSPFDFKRNSIKTYDKYSLSFKASKKNAPKTVDVIKLILENHKNDKGIIHTVSNNCKKFLIESLNDSRLIDHETSNRTEQLEMFKNSDKPLVLISPSMNEGVDLPGDLCRFQIMYKLPKPDFSDKQVKLRTQIDEFWYDYKTALALVQTHGRGMRFEDDYCKTYFIDNRLNAFVKNDLNGNNFLPEYFRNAIDAIPLKIKSETPNEDPFANETHKDKINRKYRLILRADQFLNEKKYESAIAFYNSLLNNELFINDYHPYRKLANAYHGARLYEKEAEIIVDFFESGRYCNNKVLNWFIDRLNDLSEMGYFDISKIDLLIDEFNSNGKLNKVLSNQPVPIAIEIRRIMKNNANFAKMKYPPEYFDSICQMDNDLSYDEQVAFKYKLYKYGNKLIKDNKLDKAIGFYHRLLTHELFINDYHPYRKLARVYRRKRQYTVAVDVIVDFFKSGRYCNKKQFRWFCNQLEDLSRYGNFDINQLDDLKEEFFSNGAKNKSLSNEPVIIAARLNKLYQTKSNALNSSDYMKDFFRSQNKVNADNVFLNNLNNERYTKEYFYSLSEEFLKKSKFSNDRDLIKYYTEFIPIYEDYEKIEAKANLIKRGKDIENEDYNKSIEFYESLKTNELFIHDYYPYRRQCIIFKHKLHKDLEVWDAIISLFSNEIYCNDYQYIWLNNLIDELIYNLKLYDEEISQVDELLERYENNQSYYEEIQNTPVPIAERILKDDKGLVLISQESYDNIQHIFYEKEFGKGLIKNKKYDFAIEYHVDLLKRDSYYYKHFACKQLAKISKKLGNHEFMNYFKKYEDDFLEAIK